MPFPGKRHSDEWIVVATAATIRKRSHGKLPKRRSTLSFGQARHEVSVTEFDANFASKSSYYANNLLTLISAIRDLWTATAPDRAKTPSLD
jgi:hypothetical protein